MSQKKKEYSPFKKHFWIPFGLSLLIIAIGIFMTLTDQTDLAYYKGRLSGRQNYVLTGPVVIVFGTLLSIVFLYIKRYLK